MPYRIHYGIFSKAKDAAFVSTTALADLDLFQKENPDFQNYCSDFSQAARLQVMMYTLDHYGKDALEKIIVPGQEFRIVSIKAMEKELDQIFSFTAVSSITGALAPDTSLLGLIKEEVASWMQDAATAKENWGAAACFLIW